MKHQLLLDAAMLVKFAIDLQQEPQASYSAVQSSVVNVAAFMLTDGACRDSLCMCVIVPPVCITDRVHCSFEVQEATMEFGPVPYDDVSQLNIVLRSTGLVPFRFYAELDAPGDPAYCSLYPRQGDLAHGGYCIMSLKVRRRALRPRQPLETSGSE